MKDWTDRAARKVGLQGKRAPPTPAADQPPGHTQVPAKHSPPVAVDVPVMPTPPIFFPPLMPPPTPLGEMPPLPFPNAWTMAMSMQPPAFPVAGMGAPRVTLPEPLATPPLHGQGIVVPPPGPNLHLELPKASSSAGLVELAIGVTKHFHGLHAAIAQVAYNQHMALYSAQVVPKSTPPARVCIPNCVGYSQ
jgi:hypothetical protein